MKSVIILLCFAIVSTSAAPSLLLGGAATLVGPAAPGVAVKGPAAKATVVGPDGSVISGAADAGAVLAAPRPGGVVSAAVAPGAIALGAPGLIAGPIAPWGLGGVLAGPSGVVVSGLGAGLVAPGLIGHGW